MSLDNSFDPSPQTFQPDMKLEDKNLIYIPHQVERREINFHE